MAQSASHGWEGRVLNKTALAGGAGSVGGWILAIRKGGPKLQWAAATALSCSICAVTFSGIQEAARAVRSEVSPLNSAIAGGISGYVISALHYGHLKRSPAVGLASALLGTVVDASQYFIDFGSAEDSDSGEPQLPAADKPPQALYYNQTGTWRDMLPVKKLSEEEWEEHLLRKKNARRKRIEYATGVEKADDD